MLRTLFIPAFGLATIIAFASNTRAAVAVGDSPKLAFKSAGGEQIDISKYKGKYVLVDFWATWCGPCMAEAGHMVQVNEEYGPKGLVFIGISLDQDLNEMKNVAKEKKFTWPQYFDGLVWQNKLAGEWGVRGIPATFLIDPDGKVAWTGHPGRIDQVLKDAFEKNPPKLLDEKTLAAATAGLDTAAKKLADKDPSGALKALGTVPADAKGDARISAKFTEVQKGVEAAAAEMLTGVQPLIAAKNYTAAGSKLREIAMSMKGTPTGDKAKQQLDELMAKPEVKSQLVAMEKNEKSKVELAAARKLQAEKKDDQAYARFKVIASAFAGTDGGKEAAAEVAKYEKDPAFVKKQNESAAASKANSGLSLARAYASSGKGDLATKKYQSVIEEFPGTSFAATAKKELDALPK